MNAVGGCLIGKRDTFLDINGFNPNIIGWGFEENDKSDHKFHTHNAKEWQSVAKMTKSDLIEYIKTWNLKN